MRRSFTNAFSTVYTMEDKVPADKEKIIVPVDAVSCDGHKVALGCHDVTQQGQVAVVHVETVEIQHLNNELYQLSTKQDY